MALPESGGLQLPDQPSGSYAYGNHCVMYIAGPTVWNSLPDDLRDPTVNSVQFRRNLKTGPKIVCFPTQNVQ